MIALVSIILFFISVALGIILIYIAHTTKKNYLYIVSAVMFLIAIASAAYLVATLLLVNAID